MLTRTCKLVSGFFLLLVVFTSRPANAETWKIITLDWPPYTDESLPEYGAACQAFRETMASVGIQIEYTFMPWNRGIYEVNKKDFVGLFPVWKNNNYRGGKNSPALFSSPIAFVYNKDKILKWKKLDDLKGHPIGIVENYGYPPEILELGKKGVLTLKPVPTDEQNLRMLGVKRIDLTIVDLVNGRYLAEVRYPELRDKLYFDPTVYQKADLYLSLKDDATFKARTDKIAEALKKTPMQPRIDALLKPPQTAASQSESKKPQNPGK
jgi:polar amino acid transport system substrate-binding protein